MKSLKMIVGGLMLVLASQAFGQTDTTKKDTTKRDTPKDTTKSYSLASSNYFLLDTVPKKDTSTKDTTKMFAFNELAKGPYALDDNYLVMDTVPQKDTTTRDTTKKDTTWLGYNQLAKGPYAIESNYILVDTVPADTSKKSRLYGSLAPIPQMEPLTEFKPSAPAPNFGKYYIAVLGNYHASTPDAAVSDNVTISADEQNPGKIWISGIGQEKFYAYLKNEANTYKIPAQKVGETKIEEGIVAYDEISKQVHIRVGSGYNDADPSSSLNATATTDNATGKEMEHSEKKSKQVAHASPKKAVKKIISFDGNKTDAGTASIDK